MGTGHKGKKTTKDDFFFKVFSIGLSAPAGISGLLLLRIVEVFLWSLSAGIRKIRQASKS